MITEARKLHLIEEVLKINSDTVLAELESVIKKSTKLKTTKKLSDKYAGALKLSDAQRQDLQKHLEDIGNEWVRDI